MKKVRKLVTLLISITMLMNFSLVSFASDTATIFNYSYELTDDVFQDTFNVRNEDGTVSTIVRTVELSGQTTVILKSQSGIRTFNGHVDYNALVVAATGDSRLARVNVHDSSKFYHTLLNRNSARVTREEGEFSKDIITAIISSYLGVPGDIIGDLVNLVYGITNDPACAYVIVDESIYEVLFRADRVYYTHCYHENIVGYRANGSVLPNSSYNRTYERVGG